MAIASQLEILNQGVEEWNRWRKKEWENHSGANLYAVLDITPVPTVDLRGADLSGRHLVELNLHFADLRGANFHGATLGLANLHGADLRDAVLSGASLRGATLSNADLRNADLRGTDLSGADLTDARLQGAKLGNAKLTRTNLRLADFSTADLRNADLEDAAMVDSRFDNANLTGCRIYGISAWDVSLAGAIQKDLVITPPRQPVITVDNLEIAQFVYLLLNNAKIRDVIDTITSKAVLILGRFTPERKATLDALRDALRGRNYLPIVFDFEKPDHRDFTETVSTLAHLARFVIADLTDPRSIPQELTAIIPQLLSVPVRALLLGSQREWAMFRDLTRYPQVIEPFHYTDDAMLLSNLQSQIIDPAEQRALKLAGK